MSDPRKNVEIEDVLSSIRRLVSQDGAMAHRSAPYRTPDSALQPAPPEGLIPAAPLEPEEAPCLVLTPALRVSGHQAEAPDADFPDTPESTDAAPQTNHQDGLDAVAPQDEAIVSEPAHDPHDADQDSGAERSQAAEPAQDWGEQTAATDEPQHPTATFDAGAAPDLMWQAESENDASDAAPPQAAEARGDLGAELSRLEDTIAEMEAAVADSGIEFEPERGDSFPDKDMPDVNPLVEEFDGAEWPSEADETAFDATDETALDATDETAFDATDETARDAADDSQPTVSDDAPADLAPATDGAFLPEAEAPAADAAHDEGLNEAEWAESGALDWDDEAEAEATAGGYAAATGPRRLHLADAQHEPRRPEIKRSSYDDLRRDTAAHTVDHAEVPSPGSFDTDDEDLLDEAALRALVSEIIRKELQGTLGERITRNVRKLVRREIQRALTSQEFD